MFIKSPLRYPGGKSRTAKIISELFPACSEYREPFLGGGSVFVGQKQLFPHRRFWINDAYFDLFNFWKASQKNNSALIKKVSQLKVKFPDGKLLYQFLKNNLHDFTETDRAAAFFVFNRITFSGTTLSGGYSEAVFQGRFTTSSIERLKPLEMLFKDAKITNFDYQKLLEKDGDDVFIYLDPPYFSARKSKLYGKKGHLHSHFDYERFADSMKNCRHKWLITLDDCEYVRELFSFAEVVSWKTIYGMRNVKPNSNRIGEELFVSNYL